MHKGVGAAVFVNHLASLPFTQVAVKCSFVCGINVPRRLRTRCALLATVLSRGFQHVVELVEHYSLLGWIIFDINKSRHTSHSRGRINVLNWFYVVTHGILKW